jgi:very-short-patch-repair endonuclease
MENITRAALIAQGVTDRQIRVAVACGDLLRLRPGHYARPTVSAPVGAAVSAGGRLACVSELRHLGVWVLDSNRLHIHVSPGASRLPKTGSRVHWSPLVAPGAATSSQVGTVDALVQAHGCLGRFAWMASVDSALRLGSIRRSDIAVIRAAISREDRRLLSLVDPRSASGLETIVRMIALELGFRVRVQVEFSGVGVVDLVIEDWVVVETDGTTFHGESLGPRDRRRDSLLTGMGRSVLRPGYSLIVFDRITVARQLIGAVQSHRRVKDAGRIAARARRRLDRVDLS